ncbi:MAG: DMT family transporter [Bacteroidota bacterium]
MKSKYLAYPAVIFASVFWGTSFVWSKSVLNVLSPYSLVFFRLILSTAMLVIISGFLGYFGKIKKSDFKLFVLCAIFQPVLYFIGETFGLKYISSSLTSVLIATIPLFVPFAAYFFLKIKIRLFTIVGIIISFSGVFIMMAEPGMLGTDSTKGLMFLLLAVLSAVGYSVVIKKLTDNYHPVTILTYQNIIGMIAFIPFFLIFDCKDFAIEIISTDIFITLLKLSLFSSTLAFICFIYSIKIIGVNRTSVFNNIIPVVTVIFAYFVINETITIQKAGGILIVIAGVTLSQINIKKRNNENV